MAEEVREHFADQVLKTAIPRSVRVSEAPSYGQTVMTYDPASPGALSYLEAAREVAGQVTSRCAGEGGAGMTRDRHRPPRPGPGLGSLIPTAPTGTPDADDGRAARPRGRSRAGAPRGRWYAEVPADQIVPNRVQPRQVFGEDEMAELVNSIRAVGPAPADRGPPAAGARRLRAGDGRAALAGRPGGRTRAIPAIVRATDDTDMLRDALLENLHRSQLNPLEEAAAYQQLLEDFGCTHDELAQRIGRSRPQISNTIRLLKLSPAVQRRVAAGVLSAGHARSLLGRRGRRPAGPARRPRGGRGHQRARPGGDRRDRWRRGGAAAPAPRRNKPVAPGLTDLAERLSDRFETRVKVDLGRHKGKITVEFASLDDLRRIVDIMDPRNRRDRPI